jgi:hypothetical protein
VELLSSSPPPNFLNLRELIIIFFKSIQTLSHFALKNIQTIFIKPSSSLSFYSPPSIQTYQRVLLLLPNDYCTGLYERLDFKLLISKMTMAGLGGPDLMRTMPSAFTRSLLLLNH